MRLSERGTVGRLEGVAEKVERAARRRGGLPDTEAGLSVLVLGLPGARMSGCQGARRREFEAARAAGAGTANLERELRGLSEHIRQRDCESGAERLQNLVSDGVEAIARQDLPVFRRLGREVGRELRRFLAVRQGEWGKNTLKLFDYPKSSAWQSLCLGSEALRVSWTRLERARREEAEAKRREARAMEDDRRFDQAVDEVVKRLGARQGSGAPDAASGPAAGGEDAAAAPPTDTKEVIRDDGDSRLA